jgi:glycerol-1-phosphatase
MLPGNGSFVAALKLASDREPQVAGKPAAPLLQQAIERAGARRALVVGDRLDTDIAGAHAVDADSLLVLTGVSTAADLLVAGPEYRPTFLGADLRVLGDGLEATRVLDGEPAGWQAHRDGRTLVLRSGEGAGGDGAAALRALCRVAWDGADGHDGVRGDDDRAEQVITTLGLREG